MFTTMICVFIKACNALIPVYVTGSFFIMQAFENILGGVGSLGTVRVLRKHAFYYIYNLMRTSSKATINAV